MVFNTIYEGKASFSSKIHYSDGAIIEMKIWRVPKTWGAPEGYKYSLVYISKEGKRILGYDNAEGKGHHCHKGKRVKPFRFISVKKLTEVFYKEVKKKEGGSNESKKYYGGDQKYQARTKGIYPCYQEHKKGKCFEG